MSMSNYLSACSIGSPINLRTYSAANASDVACVLQRSTAVNQRIAEIERELRERTDSKKPGTSEDDHRQNLRRELAALEGESKDLTAFLQQASGLRR